MGHLAHRATACNPKVAIGLAELSIPQAQTIVEIGRQKFDNVATGLHEQPIFVAKPASRQRPPFPFSRVTIDAKSCRLILER